jgi:poly-beta-1,6-N-acetyl-D-glucosamine synthase
MTRRYVLITPCRDEAAYLQTTIDTVAAQTVRPAKWVIVDDGSKDETPQILERAAQKYPYIQVIRREDRGQRAVGPGVIEAFYDGLNAVDLDAFDYVCKFDGDLEMPQRYFERLMEIFEADAWLGTLSGKLFLRYGEKTVEERCGDENSVGPAKFYRVQCFRDIGGFVRQVSWDGIDGHMCRLKGWVARSMHDPDLRIIHLRRMGSSQKSFWTGRVRWGRGKYFMGSTLFYVTAVAMYRMLERPYVLSGVGIWWGYVKAMFARQTRFDDPAYLKFFRRFELRSLLFGKRRTMNRYHDLVRREFPPPAQRDISNGAKRPATMTQPLTRQATAAKAG